LAQTYRPLRFRADLLIDDARPWEEFDWVGRDNKLGGVTFSVDRKNGRCGATNQSGHRRAGPRHGAGRIGSRLHCGTDKSTFQPHIDSAA
jgi:uncharacterized protein YcbX